MIINCAYLVEDDRTDVFMDRIQCFGREHEESGFRPRDGSLAAVQLLLKRSGLRTKSRPRTYNGLVDRRMVYPIIHM
jgi:hypothetical protein